MNLYIESIRPLTTQLFNRLIAITGLIINPIMIIVNWLDKTKNIFTLFGLIGSTVLTILGCIMYYKNIKNANNINEIDCLRKQSEGLRIENEKVKLESEKVELENAKLKNRILNESNDMLTNETNK